jgi:hypothetical protein
MFFRTQDTHDGRTGLFKHRRADEGPPSRVHILPGLTTIAWRQPIREIALHLTDLVGADFGEALVEWLCSEAGGRVALIMPVFFEAFGERHGAVAIRGVHADVERSRDLRSIH